MNSNIIDIGGRTNICSAPDFLYLCIDVSAGKALAFLKIEDRMTVFSKNTKVILALASAVLLLILPGCSGYKDIRVDSCRLESISPSGFKAVEAGLSVQVYNPVKEMVISDISGTVYFDGDELGYFHAPDVTVPGKSTSDVHVEVTASLGQSFSLMGLMSMASRMDVGKFTMDASMKIKVKGGICKKIHLEGVPVENLFRKASYENI